MALNSEDLDFMTEEEKYDKVMKGYDDKEPAVEGDSEEDRYDRYANERESFDAYVGDHAGDEAPDRAAEILSLSQKMNQPVDFITRNYDKIKVRERQDKMREFAKANPGIASWINQDPIQAGTAQDDMGPLDLLGGVMDRASHYPRAFASGINKFSPAFYGWGEEVSALLPAYVGGGARKTFKQYRQESEAFNAWVKGDQEGTGWFEQQVLSGVESMGAMLPAMVGAIITKNPNTMLGIMGTQTAGESFGVGLDKGLDPLRNLNYGLTQGMIEVVTEALPAAYLLKGLALRMPLHKLIANQLMTEVPGEQVATLLQDLNDWATLNPDKPFSTYLDERPTAAAATLIATITATMGMSGAGVAINNFANKKEQTLQKDFFTALGEASEGSKTRSRLPEEYKKLVEQLTKDGPVENVYIKKTAWDAYWKEREEDPREAYIEVMGTATGYETPVKGDIVIATGDYAAKIAPTEHNAALSEHLRTAKDAPTTSEAIAELKSSMSKLNGLLR